MADRQWGVEGLVIYETGDEEWGVEGVVWNEDQAAAPAGTSNNLTLLGVG